MILEEMKTDYLNTLYELIHLYLLNYMMKQH